METSAPQHKAYWRKSLTITWIGLFVWFAATAVIGFYAREARDLTALYAVIIGVYAWSMSRQDKIYR